MQSVITKKSKAASHKQLIYFVTAEKGNICILEIPDNIDLDSVKLVKLHISKKKKQDCHLAGAPALTSLYSIVNNCQVDLPSQEIVKIEKDLQAQFNMGAYEYTVKAVRIHGD